MTKFTGPINLKEHFLLERAKREEFSLFGCACSVIYLSSVEGRVSESISLKMTSALVSVTERRTMRQNTFEKLMSEHER